jgi:hypothetical protein
MEMRLTLLFFLLACSTGLGQQDSCSVPVNVIAPDLSSLPKGEADAFVETWRQNILAMKYRLPNGGWDPRGEVADFTLTLIRARGWAPQTLRPGPVTGLKIKMIQLKNLPPGAFIAGDKTHPLQTRSFAINQDPRRIILVVENDKRVTPAARTIEGAVVSDILSKARAEDSFALLTAGGPRLALGFSSSQEALGAAAKQLAAPPQGKWEKRGGVLDALLEATTWFQPARATDSIFLFAMNLEGKHGVSLARVRATVISGHIRIFGFELGEVSQPDLVAEFPHPGALFSMPEIGLGNVDHFFALSSESGGEVIPENTLGGKTYQLNAGRLNALQGAAQVLYRFIAECFLVQLEPSSARPVVGLKQEVLLQHPWVRLSFPQDVPACINATTPTRREANGTQ